MPRGGSPSDPPADAPPQSPFGAMNIGEIVNAPFAVLPDPGQVFLVRARRFEALAPGHALEGYLRLIGAIAAAQHEIVSVLPSPALPHADLLTAARTHQMPPIPMAHFVPDSVADATFTALAERLSRDPATASAAETLAMLASASAPDRAAMMAAVVNGEVPAEAIAVHVLAAAAVQVHFARLAAQLDVTTLQKVANGVCPSCGGRPVASAIVGWDGAANTRFCTCSICATQWNVPRITCLSCGAEKGIVYHGLEGGSDAIKAETCESCGSYVKILYQIREPGLDAVADDVATLGLDLKLRDEGVARAGANPFLLGY